eukprot:6787787-Prymnesium_polylepis.1
MQRSDDAAWFAEPVDLEAVADYTSVVATPMDYATVGQALREGKYSKSPLAFGADMRRIFSNALQYNWDAEQECHQAAIRGMRQFEKLFAELLSAHV